MTRHRSMSKRALLLEAQSPLHLVSHHPHNPYCETCILAHLKQSRMHRKTPAADDELPATTDTGQKLSADHIIVARDANPDDPKAAFTGETYAFSVRDRFSGMALVFPQTKKNKEETYKALKFFQGLSGRFRPDIMVKSDHASEITSAVAELGWHPDPSLENRFPHNAEHERWIGIVKSVQRACVSQSGLPPKTWNLSFPFAAIALSVIQKAPI